MYWDMHLAIWALQRGLFRPLGWPSPIWGFPMPPLGIAHMLLGPVQGLAGPAPGQPLDLGVGPFGPTPNP